MHLEHVRFGAGVAGSELPQVEVAGVLRPEAQTGGDGTDVEGAGVGVVRPAATTRGAGPDGRRAGPRGARSGTEAGDRGPARWVTGRIPRPHPPVVAVRRGQCRTGVRDVAVLGGIDL